MQPGQHNILPQQEQKIEIKPMPIIEKQPVIQEESGEYLSYWKDVINTLKGAGKVMLYTNLMNTRAKEINDAVIGIEFLNGISSFGKSVIDNNMQELKKTILKYAGKEMHIKILENKPDVGATQPQETQNIEDMVKSLDIPINIIE